MKKQLIVAALLSAIFGGAFAQDSIQFEIKIKGEGQTTSAMSTISTSSPKTINMRGQSDQFLPAFMAKYSEQTYIRGCLQDASATNSIVVDKARQGYSVSITPEKEMKNGDYVATIKVQADDILSIVRSTDKDNCEIDLVSSRTIRSVVTQVLSRKKPNIIQLFPTGEYQEASITLQ